MGMREGAFWPLGEQAIRDIELIAARHGISTESAKELYWSFGKEERWIKCAIAVGTEQTRRLRSELGLHLDPHKLTERIKELQAGLP